MNNKEEIAKELKEISPKLAALYGAKEEVVVPDHFFEEVRIEVKEQIQKKRTNYHFLLKVVSTIAAALLLLVLLDIGDFTSEEEYLSAITKNEAEQYVLEHIEEYSTEVLFEELDVEVEVHYSVEDVLDELSDEELDEILELY